MKKFTKLIIGSAGILVLSLALGTTPANAAQRDIITEAEAICATATSAGFPLQNTCEVRAKTNGEQILGFGCNQNFDLIDNEVADYLLRNCHKNEKALLRQASSAVLSLDDYIVRGKKKQKEAAAGYLCSYAVKAALLVGTDKLVLTVDLVADAENIADALEFPCD